MSSDHHGLDPANAPSGPSREPPDAVDSRFRLGFTGRAAREEAAKLRRALSAVPQTASRRRVKLLSRLAAAELPYDRAQATATAGLAEELADETDDDLAEAYALVARAVVDLSPRTLRERSASARRALSTCVRTGEQQLAPTSFFLLLGALTEAADIDAVDRELALTSTSLEQLDDLLEGRHATWFRCMRATIDGRVDDAQRLADAGYALAERETDPDALIVWAGQTAMIKWLQAKTEEVEHLLTQARQEHPDEPVWAAAVARIWLQQGRTDAAAGLLASLPPLASFPSDRNWLAAVAILAEVAVELGPLDLVTELYDALAPYGERLVTIGLGVSCWGTVARTLALLAQRLGRDDDAVGHYRRAIELCSRIGAQVWLAEAHCELAELLLRVRGDESAVRDLARQAAYAARHLALDDIAERAERMLAGDGEPGVEDAPRIRFLGTFAVLAVDGSDVSWRSRKAGQLLKILIARRGTPIPREQLLDILWPGEPPAALVNRLAVAVSTVRSALDPLRVHPRDHFVTVDTHVVALNRDRIRVDGEEFLSRAESALAAAEDRQRTATAASADDYAELCELVDGFPGAAFPDEPYARWAEPLRRDITSRFCAVAHVLARESALRGDHVKRIDVYGRILDADEYDELAHSGLVAALTAVGSHGQARDAQQLAHTKLAELGIKIAPPRR